MSALLMVPAVIGACFLLSVYFVSFAGLQVRQRPGHAELSFTTVG